jgi:hypothetical protein
MFVSTSPAVL